MFPNRLGTEFWINGSCKRSGKSSCQIISHSLTDKCPKKEIRTPRTRNWVSILLSVKKSYKGSPERDLSCWFCFLPLSYPVSFLFSSVVFRLFSLSSVNCFPFHQKKHGDTVGETLLQQPSSHLWSLFGKSVTCVPKRRARNPQENASFLQCNILLVAVQQLQLLKYCNAVFEKLHGNFCNFSGDHLGTADNCPFELQFRKCCSAVSELLQLCSLCNNFSAQLLVGKFHIAWGGLWGLGLANYFSEEKWPEKTFASLL